MATKHEDYWKKRMEALEDENYRRSMGYYKDVQEQFRRASQSMQADIDRWYRRFAENNDISYASAKRLLKKGELEEFKWSVEQYIKAGRENSVDQRWMKELENASARFHISYLETMKLQAQHHAELLAAEFEGSMEKFLHQNYAEQFYRTAFEVSKGTGTGFNLARLDERRIDTLIKHPWAQDGKDFSDRIWSNKEKLVNNLHTELSQCIIRGEAPRSAINRLAKKMDVSKAQAGTLIMTESAAIASASQRDCYKELEVEQYQFDAALDEITCGTCQGLDQKIFKMSEYEVGVTAPPIHPRCRCCTTPHFDDWEEFGISPKRAARDSETGKTVYVDGCLKYADWKHQYVDKPDLKESNPGAGNNNKSGRTRRVDVGNINPDMKDEAISYFENSIRNDPVENAVVIDSDGNVVQFIGEKDSVDIFDVELKNSIVTHNHPDTEGIVSFGEDDFSFLKDHQDVKEFRCINAEYSYRIAVLKNISSVVYNDLYKEGLKYFMDTDFEPQDAAMRVLHERGYVSYERKRIES